MYVDAPIHAKVYIMRKDPTKADYFGSVITGSSNFSEAGLVNNLEFNVELKDSDDVKFALDRFEELWKDGIPIQDAYVDAVEKKTWLRNDITPYEIYLKTLYEFFREEINSDKDVLARNLLPDGYMRLQYQLDAVVQAKKTLQAYNGVFISDVVGLGKTYICAMLAKSLGKGKKLVICPPVLVSYWEEVLLEFDVAAKVVSLGKLDRILEGNIDYEYVFVDEAHRFRNAGTDSFSKLHEICYGKKVVLISATPINNYGVISFIVPNKLVSAPYTVAVRKLMAKNSVQEIRDYSDVNVFKSAAVYPVVFRAQTCDPDKAVVMDVMDDMEHVANHNVIGKLHKRTPYIMFNYNIQRL